jgi:hypothetical protein
MHGDPEPEAEGQEHDMRVRRPSGGCDVHQRTESDRFINPANFLERRFGIDRFQSQRRPNFHETGPIGDLNAEPAVMS